MTLDLVTLLERARLTKEETKAAYEDPDVQAVDAATAKAVRVTLAAVEDELETEYGSQHCSTSPRMPRRRMHD